MGRGGEGRGGWGRVEGGKRKALADWFVEALSDIVGIDRKWCMFV